MGDRAIGDLITAEKTSPAHMPDAAAQTAETSGDTTLNFLRQEFGVHSLLSPEKVILPQEDGSPFTIKAGPITAALVNACASRLGGSLETRAREVVSGDSTLRVLPSRSQNFSCQIQQPPVSIPAARQWLNAAKLCYWSLLEEMRAGGIGITGCADQDVPARSRRHSTLTFTTNDHRKIIFNYQDFKDIAGKAAEVCSKQASVCMYVCVYV